MNLSVSKQVDLVIKGEVYDFAVANGIIARGEPLRYSRVLTLTKEQASEELERRGYPGIDHQVSQFRDVRDGLGWDEDSGSYRIYFYERGSDSDISFHDSEDEFRTAWKDIYIRMYFSHG
ncbi:MAG: hypothetical protein P1U87_13420 [Verrucomicrobiales bacterium]|nr:hypothetical protein [Verrucomicrobiales bacterium]